MKFTEKQLNDLLSDAELVHSRPWRHGTYCSYVFEHEGKHYECEVPIHHEEGWQLQGDQECLEVRKVMKMVESWESVK